MNGGRWRLAQPGGQHPDQRRQHATVGDLIELGLGEPNQPGVTQRPHRCGAGRVDQQPKLAEDLTAAQLLDHDVAV